MKKIRLKGSAKTIIIFSLVALMIVPTVFSITGNFGGQQEVQGTDQELVKGDFTDAELQQFADVYVKTMDVQMKNEAQMTEAIEAEKIDLNRFNEIYGSQLNPEAVKADEKEMASFNKAFEKINKIQQETEKEVEGIIEQEMGIDKYQQIIMAYQQHKNVQEKLHELLGINAQAEQDQQ